MALDLAIAIPARNDERKLASCLQAIGSDLVRHVVVIDSGNTDAIAAVALAHGAELIQFFWAGRFPKQRNWYLPHQPPSHHLGVVSRRR